MKLFSRSLAGYARLLAPALLAMTVVALLRFALGPVLGVESGPIERIVSMTTVALGALLVYGILLGAGEGRLGDVAVVGLALTLAMTLLLLALLPASAALGLSNAYLDPAHLGRRSAPLDHAFAHVGVIPMQTLISSVLCGVVFGLARLGRFVRRRFATA